MCFALPGAENGNILLSDVTKNRISLVRFRFGDLGRLSVIFLCFFVGRANSEWPFCTLLSVISSVRRIALCILFPLRQQLDEPQAYLVSAAGADGSVVARTTATATVVTEPAQFCTV